jgi:hypothetical protein
MSRRILLLTLIAGTLVVGAVVYILVGNVGEAPLPEEAYDPAPGYKLLQDPTDGLTVEVPRDWRVLTGSDSEGEPPNWSSYAGQKITSSVSAAPDLEAWRKREGPGTHIVASRNLARRFSDGEIVSSGPNDFSYNCETWGDHRDFERGPYSGTKKAWKNCFGKSDGSALSVVAAPAGRKCVVLLHVIMYGKASKEVGEHILDTFEVDCKAIAG